MKIEIEVSTGKIGSKVTKVIDLPDECTDEEISEEVLEHVLAYNLVNIDWFRA
jgi:hypothetical protein